MSQASEKLDGSNDGRSHEQIHFVTGRLAEPALRRVVDELARQVGFGWTLQALPITVAALMTPAWVARHLHVPPGTSRIILPGYCEGDLQPLQAAVPCPVERGPRDLRRLPEHFGRRRSTASDLEAWDVQIVAEINHAPRLSLPELVRQARRLADDGADVIDVGCDPGPAWSGVADAIRAVKDLGLRASVDSLNPREIAPAVRAGAELVLSVNSSNRDAAPDWGCEVVAIPDEPGDLGSLDETIERLAVAGVPLRIDPILEPIGCGFAASLDRYQTVRRRYPEAEMLMGIGNLTELTDVDSAGVNVLLLGFCQELGVRSVLTTQVINWARTSVRECDLARRLVRFAVEHRVPPKNVDPRLVSLRDPRPLEYGDETLAALAARIKDHNYRLFAERGLLHLLGGGLHLQDADPFLLFDRLLAATDRPVDASHAFYLGYELAKAKTALTLGKDYRQDESLDWGYLTIPEPSHRERRKAAEQAAREAGAEDGDSASGDSERPPDASAPDAS